MSLKSTTCSTGGSDSSAGGPQHKADVRSRVWQNLRQVAYPDSRFHLNFSSFIPDFQGSDAANDALLSHPCYPSPLLPKSEHAAVFITPDNCLEYLREKTLERGIKVLTTTYGIRRGLQLLDPKVIPSSLYRYASILDGMEKVAQPVTLAEIAAQGLEINLMVTGTGAINKQGIRFGKGHGYFDLEWAMLYSVGVVSTGTITAAVVHDCQVLQGQGLVPEPYDTVCDLVFTPTTVFHVDGAAAAKPTCGILWDRLEANMWGDIPPLRELKTIEQARENKVSSS